MKLGHLLVRAVVWVAAFEAIGSNAAVVSGHRALRVSKGLRANAGPFLASNGTEVEQVVSHVQKTSLKKNAESKYGHFTDSLQCGVTVKVGADTDKSEQCPSTCPYFAQDLTDEEHCTYVCVVAADCAKQNPNRPIADTIQNKFGQTRKVCRSAYVQHCKKALIDGTDRCETCQTGYYLSDDGQCVFKLNIILYILGAIAIVLLVIIIVWIIDLSTRESDNFEAYNNAMDNRGWSQIKMRLGEHNDDEDFYGPPSPSEKGVRESYSIFTNLCRESKVAGSGMMLHFNFQVMVMVWAVIVMLCWLGFAVHHNELFVLGTRRFGTPRENCILVAWGYATQQRLMWTKVWFLIIVYSITFVGTLLHAIRQRRMYQYVEERTQTMADFAILLNGLPKMKGTDKVELDIKKQMSKECKNVVGVSVCWDYQDKDDMEFVQDTLAKDLLEREKEAEEEWYKKHGGGKSRIEEPIYPSDEGEKDKHSTLRRFFLWLEIYIFGTPKKDSSKEPEPERDATQFLENITTTDKAFVIFETAKAAEDAFKKGSCEFEYDGKKEKVIFEKVEAAPNAVCWGNFGAPIGRRIMRGVYGGGCILLALLFWTVCFYLPYAWSVFTWNYENGNEPPGLYGFAFSMVVVIGNAIMYQVCSDVSDGIRFFYLDDREAAYLVFYLVACSFNIAVDMVSTYFMSYFIMTGLDFRTYDGTKLEHVKTFTEQFETYAIQRHLAESLYAYAWPSTFLIPFLIEPFPTIVLPLVLAATIVCKNKAIRGKDAQENLAPIPFDMGRYADLLLNMLLGVLLFYVPGGYTIPLFGFMALSHAYIYAFDHWKILRNIPTVTYTSSEVDGWSLIALAPINGIILSCLIFKMNGQHYGIDMEGPTMVAACFAAFAIHVVVHIALLRFLPAAFAKRPNDSAKPEPKPEPKSYQDLNEKKGCNYFTANPLNCLRSQLFYKDPIPCVYYMASKEHLIKKNPKIGCYYDGPLAQPPLKDYSAKSLKEEAAKSASKTLKSISRKASSVGK